MATGPNEPDEQQVPGLVQPPTLARAKRAGRHPQIPEVRLREETKWPGTPPRAETILATIRKLVQQHKFFFMDHGEFRFEKRFQEMGFDMFDLLQILESGVVCGEIEAGKKAGEWKVKLIGVPEGTSRKMGVVTIVVRDERLLIKTAEWEDR